MRDRFLLLAVGRQTMKLPMRLHDPHTDIMEYYCSPAEQDAYDKIFANVASQKK